MAPPNKRAVERMTFLWLLILWIQDFSLCAGFSHPSYHCRSKWRTNLQVAVAQASTAPNVENQEFVVHTGRSADMIKRAPALSGITLCQGWSPAATEAFRRAIYTCVVKNPVLSGHVYERHKRKELWIQAGTFDPNSHEFCKMIPPPTDGPSLTSLAQTENATEILDKLTTHYLDQFDASELTSEQIQKKLPLFGASLMVQDDVALFSLKVSHAVGDGVTFFEVLKQVSLIMNNDGYDDAVTIPQIEWNHPLKAIHEFYPPSFSAWDIEVSYGAPFLAGCVKNVVTQYGKRKSRVFLLDKKKVSKLKQKIREEAKGENYIAEAPVSSNDIITAGLCQANVGAEVFVFTENVRAVVDDVPRNAGGNFLWEIPVPRDVCVQPQLLRQFIQQQKHEEKSGGVNSVQNVYNLPLRPFLCGNVARVTSLASITESIVHRDVKTICTLPALSFMTDIPLDVAIIFRYNKAYWGVLHNSFDFDATHTLLEEAIEESKR